VAQSPTTAEAEGDQKDYRSGWKATYRLMREGMSWSGREANCVFLNLDGRRFSDVSGISGANFKDDARGLALVDWDFDGAVDIWFKNRSAPQVRFLHNRLAGDNGFLSLRLRGTSTNRDGIGARVEVYLSGESSDRLVRTLHAGDGYLSQSTKWLHFGLGRARQIERVVVHWSGGEKEEFSGLEKNRQYLLVQGGEAPQLWQPPERTLSLKGENLKAPVATGKARIVLAARPSMPPLDYRTLSEELQRVRTRREPGRSLLLNLWASSCAPCLVEMTEFTRRADEFEERGLSVLALSVDLEEDHDAARALLERIDWPFEAGFTTNELLDALDLIQRSMLIRRRPLPLPASFLITASGGISVIYKGPLDVDQLFSDLELEDASPLELRYAASPLEGRWLFTSFEMLGVTIRLVRELRDHGLTEAAAAVFRTLEVPGELVEDAGGRRKYLQLAEDLSRQLEKEERHAAAAELYALMYEIEPMAMRWRQSRGENLERSGREEDAAEVYREILRLRPAHATTLLRLSTLLLRQEKLTEALALLQRAVKVRSDHWRANYLLGSTLVKLGRPEEAKAPLRRALALKPDHSEARALLEGIR
jgi:tetratricopeptide (TPR) repeat protein